MSSWTIFDNPETPFVLRELLLSSKLNAFYQNVLSIAEGSDGANRVQLAPVPPHSLSAVEGILPIINGGTGLAASRPIYFYENAYPFSSASVSIFNEPNWAVIPNFAIHSDDFSDDPLLIMFEGSVVFGYSGNSSNILGIEFGISIDGSLVPQNDILGYEATREIVGYFNPLPIALKFPVIFNLQINPTPGAHTIQVLWRLTNIGDSNAFAAFNDKQRSLTAFQIV